eukprot:CAMPEP_0183375572 /NCGR_PEP_ID=MMETSP0164_2-20130417/117758_1 /TAXON_ID=221442 /ORGANISM="Coccolithus pelagicus ssp braarudi, Strain PLY182g" /LENGTH=129 /DNA_ID=CAMNT_0025552751 /DNA_START=118 /DNA_END=507 /DNA_ORIENTATION=+
MENRAPATKPRKSEANGFLPLNVACSENPDCARLLHPSESSVGSKKVKAQRTLSERANWTAGTHCLAVGPSLSPQFCAKTSVGARTDPMRTSVAMYSSYTILNASTRHVARPWTCSRSRAGCGETSGPM